MKVLCNRCCKGEATHFVVYIWQGRLYNSLSCHNHDNGCPDKARLVSERLLEPGEAETFRRTWGWS